MVTFSYGVVLTPGQWNLLFNQKQNALGYTPVNRAGDTMLGPLVTAPSNVNGAGFSILPGVAPENPVDGMYWATIDGLFYQIGGATVGPFGTGDVAGPPTSVVNHIPVFSTTDGSVLADSGISLGSQAANLLLATPGAGAGAPTFRLMVGADLPTPQTVALGGMFSSAAPTHNFATGINTSGYLTFGQPAIGDISGLAANMASFLAGGTSAQLAATVVDETGSGPLVFANGPVVSLGNGSTVVTQTPGDNSTKPASTAYVQAAIFGTTTLPASKYATTAALPAVTYANGASGVGATLTANANGALTVDGVAAAVNDVLLIKNQASTFQNGIYTVTATGSAGPPFVLTRAPYYNLAADIDNGDQTFVTGGVTLGATTWVQNGTENPVIGTNPITFAQTAGPGTFTAGTGLLLSGTQFAIDTTTTVDKTTAQTLQNKVISGLNNTISNISLSASVTGTLGVANGGTGVATVAAGDILVGAGTAAMVPTTPSAFLDGFGSTQGNVLYRAASGWVALAAGALGTVLTSGGPSANVAWAAQASAAGTLVNIQAITASGTYTPTAGATRGIAFVTGGGAGGNTGTGAGSQAGGGAGGTTIDFLSSLASTAVTIGAGGGAGAAGGSSSLGTVTANGGVAAAINTTGGRGGAATTTGTLGLAGGDGGPNPNGTGNTRGGDGGDSFWGGGGSGGNTTSATWTPGVAAQVYGAGGGGGAYAGGVGGAGAPGVVLILEFK